MSIFKELFTIIGFFVLAIYLLSCTGKPMEVSVIEPKQSVSDINEKKEDYGRFTLHYVVSNFTDCIKILTDKKTGKEYVIVKSGYGLAIMKLEE